MTGRPDDLTSDVCAAFDVPVWLVTGSARPRLFRIRWALRRFTGWRGAPRPGKKKRR
jgi:hypothetical protein